METNADILKWQMRFAGEAEWREAERARYRFVCREYLHNMDMFYRAYPDEMPAAMAEPEYLRKQRQEGRER